MKLPFIILAGLVSISTHAKAAQKESCWSEAMAFAERYGIKTYMVAESGAYEEEGGERLKIYVVVDVSGKEFYVRFSNQQNCTGGKFIRR